MSIITKVSIVTLVGFILSIIIGILLIPFLKKENFNQRLSIYLEREHNSKKNTPTFGGIIFIIPTLLVSIILLIFNKTNVSYNLLIIIITFLLYGLIGFIDDYLIVKKNNNKGLTEQSKFILQLIVSIIFFYLFLKSGNEPLLWIHILNLKINIGFLYGLFILFVLVSSSNAVNLTDGLDGLATGLSIIALTTFGIITINTGWLEGYKEITLFIFTLVGSLLGFLFFNINPAKIFMGDTGSLALGSVLGSIAILTRHELLLVLIGLVFVIETLTCIIQRIYYKFTKKRIFLMTPIHHSFELKGYSEVSIVRLFWLVGIISSIISLIIGVIL